MAKLNENLVDLTKFEESDLMNAGMLLISFLADEELTKLRKDWNEKGGYEVIPFWKYALDNVKVSY